MANILGINISGLNEGEVIKKIAEWLDGDAGHYLVTPNPEIILASHKDEEFFYVLNKADLALADGFGLQIAARLFRVKAPRLTGSDLTPKILSLAKAKHCRIAIINRSGGLSSREDIQKLLTKDYPELEFLILEIDKENFDIKELNRQINEFAPKIVFTALGAPLQEKIIYHNLRLWPSVRLALGIGGSFDFLTGKVVRAPKFMRRLGLEWLWRVLIQPEQRWKRVKRIINATFVFLAKVLIIRFINPRRYRPNVACWLYRMHNGNYEVFVVERSDAPGHWQLPQGGTDGENLIKAGSREIREETGLSHIEARGAFKNLYRYRFPKSRDFRGARGYVYDYKGQKQGLFIAELIKNDEKIKINFWDHSAWQWVDYKKLVETVHPYRQAAAKIYYEKFCALINGAEK